MIKFRSFFFLFLNAMLLHFALRSSVTASVEVAGGGWGYAGEGRWVVGHLSLHTLDRFCGCSSLLRTIAIVNLHNYFFPQL